MSATCISSTFVLLIELALSAYYIKHAVDADCRLDSTLLSRWHNSIIYLLFTVENSVC